MLYEKSSDDCSSIRKAYDSGRMIKKAGLFPKYEQLLAFQQQLKVLEDQELKISELFLRFVSISQVDKIYFMQRYKSFVKMARLVDTFD